MAPSARRETHGPIIIKSVVQDRIIHHVGLFADKIAVNILSSKFLDRLSERVLLGREKRCRILRARSLHPAGEVFEDVGILHQQTEQRIWRQAR